VHLSVVVEGGSVAEGGAADGAHQRPLARVQAHVTLELLLAGEVLLAERAVVARLGGVLLLHVLVQVATRSENLEAVLTEDLRILRVSLFVLEK
jgi:hypothetical protein